MSKMMDNRGMTNPSTLAVAVLVATGCALAARSAWRRFVAGIDRLEHPEP